MPPVKSGEDERVIQITYQAALSARLPSTLQARGFVHPIDDGYGAPDTLAGDGLDFNDTPDRTSSRWRARQDLST
jgi:hypothetical protein